VYAPGSYLHQKENEQPTFENVRTWAYGLTPGDSLTDSWPIHEFEDKNYHLRVYGPNGFFREFKGNTEDPAIQIDFEHQISHALSNKITGNVELRFNNLSDQTQSIEIIDHAYKSNKHKKTLSAKTITPMILNLEKSHHWYDFSVKVTGYRSFEKRYAGRVETGRPGYSDPFMGRVIA
ncbi:MAG: phospholipase domain-containing protein, partial [Bacteroidia bacterium]